MRPIAYTYAGGTAASPPFPPQTQPPPAPGRVTPPPPAFAARSQHRHVLQLAHRPQYRDRAQVIGRLDLLHLGPDGGAVAAQEGIGRPFLLQGGRRRQAACLERGPRLGQPRLGIGLVLSAVFGPMAFFGGSTGVIYRQFSVTVISSMLLSVLVALILTPVLCAQFLKP